MAKSENRIPEHFKKYPKEWEVQFNMLHDDGVTCNDCAKSNWCKTIIGISGNETHCDYYPNRFQPRKEVKP